MPTTSANRTRDPSKKAAENLGLRPHGHGIVLDTKKSADLLNGLSVSRKEYVVKDWYRI